MPIKVIKQLYSKTLELDQTSKVNFEIIEYEDSSRVSVLTKVNSKSNKVPAKLFFSYASLLKLKLMLNDLDFQQVEQIMKKREI